MILAGAGPAHKWANGPNTHVEEIEPSDIVRPQKSVNDAAQQWSQTWHADGERRSNKVVQEQNWTQKRKAQRKKSRESISVQNVMRELTAL